MRAEEIACALDPGQTRITFTLGASLHTVHGTFRLKRGVLRLDTESGGADGEIVVDVVSGDSGNASRDRQMREEILESSRYPEAVFLPMKFLGRASLEGESEIQVDGQFRIHGVEHPLRLEVHVRVDGGQVTATTHFEVPYVKWGMKSPNVFLLKVRDHVEVDVVTSGRVSAPAPSPAPHDR